MPNLPQLFDGDVGFTGMVSRIDPALLQKGFVAKAVNRRFDQNKIRNRWGVVRPVWGGKWTRGTRVISVTANSSSHTGVSGTAVAANTQIACDPGASQMVFPNGTRISSDAGSTGAIVTSADSFNYSGSKNASYHLSTDSLGEICGMLTYRDAETGAESLLVAVNEARSSDGGQGAVYILRPGQSHLSILSNSAETLDMNGHDFYGPVKLVQTANAVVMLRPGPVRYYFKGDNVESGTADTVTLHVTPDFTTGTKVQVSRIDSASAIGSLINDTFYFARVSGQEVSFYATRAQSKAGGATGLVALSPTSSSYRYYVEVAESINWWSQPNDVAASSATDAIVNDGPPLIMQASSSATNPLDEGFNRVPSALTVASSSTTDDTLTIYNHRFVPGDRITVGGTTYYAYPIDSQKIRIYNGTTGEAASLTGASGYIDIVDTSFNGLTVAQSGASGASIPPAREGIYFGNRLVVVYGFDHIAMSDVLDPLHYLPLIQEFKLNTGTNDPVVALYPFNQTTILVFKKRSILALENVYGDLSNVRLTEITREFGCVAAKSIASTGSDVVFLSQRGVVSLKQTEFGLEQSVVLPLSDAIQASIDEIDEPNAENACAAYWDNRYLLAVPVETGDGTNQRTLVYNFLNQAWDGLWEGDYLAPTQFERLNVNGTQRLIWTDESGFIHYFAPLALRDSIQGVGSVDIETEVRFRALACSTPDHKQFTDCELSFASWAPTLTLTAEYDGVAETATLLDGWTRDRTQYLTFGAGTRDDSNGDDDFLEPYRQDYSLLPSFQCQSGVKLNLHQLYKQKVPLRRSAAYLQPVLTTSAGSVEVYATRVAAVPFRTSAGLDS